MWSLVLWVIPPATCLVQVPAQHLSFSGSGFNFFPLNLCHLYVYQVKATWCQLSHSARLPLFGEAAGQITDGAFQGEAVTVSPAWCVGTAKTVYVFEGNLQKYCSQSKCACPTLCKVTYLFKFGHGKVLENGRCREENYRESKWQW